MTREQRWYTIVGLFAAIVILASVSVRVNHPELFEPPTNPTLGIQRVDPATFEADRIDIEHAWADAARKGRTHPHQVDDTPQGYRIGGMSPWDSLHKLGFRNRDIVHRVNQHDLDDKTVLEALEASRGDKSFAFQMTRHGRPFQLTAHVR